jgi:hypothetical protein
MDLLQGFGGGDGAAASPSEFAVARTYQRIRELLDDPAVDTHPFSLSLSLVWCACPLAVWRGDFATAASCVARLKELAEKLGSASHYGAALGYEGQLTAAAGDLKQGERLLRACLDRLQAARYEFLYTPF